MKSCLMRRRNFYRFWRIGDGRERPMRDPLDGLIPTTGWLGAYMRYTQWQEPCSSYHFLCGAAILGACVGRNVWFDAGGSFLYPNLWCLLVGPPARARKTTAILLASNLLRKTDLMPITPVKISASRLFQRLSETPHMFVAADELANFLGKKNYQEEIATSLTTVMDARDNFEYDTNAHGQCKSENMVLSALLGSTPEWLLEKVDSAVLAGGVGSRLIYCYRTDRRRFGRPYEAAYHRKEIQVLEEQLLSELKIKSKTLKGQFQLSEDASDWYDEWYEYTCDRQTLSPELQHFIERKSDHLLRLAFILTISENGHDNLIDGDILLTSLAILDTLEKDVVTLFATMTGTQIGKTIDRILQQLKGNRGKMSVKELMKLNEHRVSRRDLHEALSTMVESGDVTIDNKEVSLL